MVCHCTPWVSWCAFRPAKRLYGGDVKHDHACMRRARESDARRSSSSSSSRRQRRNWRARLQARHGSDSDSPAALMSLIWLQHQRPAAVARMQRSSLRLRPPRAVCSTARARAWNSMSGYRSHPGRERRLWQIQGRRLCMQLSRRSSQGSRAVGDRTCACRLIVCRAQSSDGMTLPRRMWRLRGGKGEGLRRGRQSGLPDRPGGQRQAPGAAATARGRTRARPRVKGFLRQMGMQRQQAAAAMRQTKSSSRGGALGEACMQARASRAGAPRVMMGTAAAARRKGRVQVWRSKSRRLRRRLPGRRLGRQSGPMRPCRRRR